MRLSKQLDQIFQLANEFDDNESDPVSMMVDECWIYAGDVAGIHKFLLCSDPSFVQYMENCDELPDGGRVIVLDGILSDSLLEFSQEKTKNPLRISSKRDLMCSGRESNPYGHFCPRDFKSRVSTYSTTRAIRLQR